MIMANKRTLKRAINQICEELLAEAIAASLYGNEQHKDNADAVLYSIIHLKDNYVSRISHVEPGMKPHVYFKDLRKKFAAEVDEIIDHINNL